MIWNADAFFAIGKTHMVCEDYAISRAPEDDNDALTYAIVCDGCSSSQNTDVGARLLAHSAALHMGWLDRIDPAFTDREKMMINEAANAANEIDMDLRCLDATLVGAYRSVNKEGDKGVRVTMRGDGVVAAHMRSGGYVFYTIDQEHNAPRYLSYELDQDRLKGYLEKFGEWSKSESYVSAESSNGIGASRIQGHPPDWFFPASTYDLVLVLSDGVQTFQRQIHTGTSIVLEPIPVAQVIEQLVQVRSPTGKFLQRRCHKFLTKFCVVNGWQHADDFSAAGIWMGDSA